MVLGRAMTRTMNSFTLALAVVILVAATVAGRADDLSSAPEAARVDLAGPGLAGELRPAVPKHPLPVIGLRLRAAPAGLAVRLADGVHVGAAAKFDPESDEAVGLIAFRLSL